MNKARYFKVDTEPCVLNLGELLHLVGNPSPDANQYYHRLVSLVDGKNWDTRRTKFPPNADYYSKELGKKVVEITAKEAFDLLERKDITRCIPGEPVISLLSGEEFIFEEDLVESLHIPKRLIERTIRSYDKPSEPRNPYSRRITEEEERKLKEHFSDFSFSTSVDANGHIHLGGGEQFCMYYTTPEDLKILR